VRFSATVRSTPAVIWGVAEKPVEEKFRKANVPEFPSANPGGF